MQANLMELREAVQHFKQFLTVKVIAKRLGVSRGQLAKYSNGETISCHQSVVDNFYDHFTLDGKPILIDYYNGSEQSYIEAREVYDKGFKDRLSLRNERK